MEETLSSQEKVEHNAFNVKGELLAVHKKRTHDTSEKALNEQDPKRIEEAKNMIWKLYL